jgi:hypothetical protein
MYAEPAAVDLDALARTAERAIEALEELGDDPGLARAWILRSEVLECQGNADQGGAAAERASVYAKRAGSRREEAGTGSVRLVHARGLNIGGRGDPQPGEDPGLN